MGVNHEPRTEFEKQAAKEVPAGKEEFETVEKGYYRRAGSIPPKLRLHQVPRRISRHGAENPSLLRARGRRANH